MIIGIIAAMEEEATLLRDCTDECQMKERIGFHFYCGKVNGMDVVLLRSGIGKVSSAVSTTLLLDHFQCDYVINIGSAGALDPRLNIGDVVISDHVNYYDVDVTNFGYALGQMAGCPENFKANEELKQRAIDSVNQLKVPHLVGDIVSGDNFINNKERIHEIRSMFKSAVAVEMEAASIAHVCYLFNTPFIVIRAISDKSDDDSTIDFTQFLPIAAAKSTEIVLALLKSLKEG